MSGMKRRKFLGLTGLALGPLALGASASAETLPLPKTPRDAEGPFYPKGDRSNDGENLLRDMTTQKGETLRFAGRVVDTQAKPQSGLVIDIWHTDPNGAYKHPYDGSPGERLDDFAYWGKAITDANGQFSFRTYVPGVYTGRPSHIHYIVWKEGKRLLTSQVYFKGFDEGTGAIIQSARHDLRQARLMRADATDFATDFRVVI